MSSSMFTFRNIVSEQMGDLRRLNVRRTARSSAARLLGMCQSGNRPPPLEKKARPKAERPVYRTPLGVDRPPEYPHR